jgi:hypothetical protein
MKTAAPIVVSLALLGTPCVSQGQNTKTITPKRSPVKKLFQVQLTVDDVLGWRVLFEDLLGKSKDVAIERFGPPDRETPERLDYDGNVKTQFRSLFVLLANDKIDTIKVFAHPWEVLPIEQVIEQAKNFCFRSGTFPNSTDDFFMATTIDTRNTIQFSISPSRIGLTGLIFDDVALTCDPGAIPYK